MEDTGLLKLTVTPSAKVAPDFEQYRQADDAGFKSHSVDQESLHHSGRNPACFLDFRAGHWCAMFTPTTSAALPYLSPLPQWEKDDM